MSFECVNVQLAQKRKTQEVNACFDWLMRKTRRPPAWTEVDMLADTTLVQHVDQLIQHVTNKLAKLLPNSQPMASHHRQAAIRLRYHRAAACCRGVALRAGARAEAERLA